MVLTWNDTPPRNAWVQSETFLLISLRIVFILWTFSYSYKFHYYLLLLLKQLTILIQTKAHTHKPNHKLLKCFTYASKPCFNLSVLLNLERFIPRTILWSLARWDRFDATIFSSILDEDVTCFIKVKARTNPWYIALVCMALVAYIESIRISSHFSCPYLCSSAS